MGFLNWTGRARAAARSQMALDIARRAEIATWQRVAGLISGMSLPEARGYIRARASSVLDEQAAAVFARTGVRQMPQRPEVLEQAAQQLVHSIIARLLQEERRSLLRRAA